MTSVCFYFQVHQPMRLRRMHLFDPPAGTDYWDHAKNKAILDRAATKCYLPANALMAEQIRKSDGWFRVAYSLSGTFLEQLEQMRPDVLESFKALAATGHVEFLAETYYHSLAGLWADPTEHKAQIEAHRRLVKRHFNQESTTFRNTELIYDDRIAATVANLGYKAIVTEGTEKILGARSPNHIYRSAPASLARHLPQPKAVPQVQTNEVSQVKTNGNGLLLATPDPSSGMTTYGQSLIHSAREPASSDLKVLLKNYRLSDDIAFRFSTPGWNEAPLTADKYAKWLAACQGDTVNLFMDYETFGEHQWPETGIFQFLEHLPNEVRKHPHLGFALPREVVAEHDAVGDLEVPTAISWADTERDVSAWLHNGMQQQCFEDLRTMGPEVLATGDANLAHAWRLLQTSDHLYYSCTKWMGDGDIHAYFSPYESPYLAYINHANAIADLRAKVQAALRR